MNDPQKSPCSSVQKVGTTVADIEVTEVIQYRLYKRRFTGLIGLAVLSLVSGMSWPWFGPIANNVVREFSFTLDEVNWLGNIVACMYLPTALAVPVIVSRYGIRRCCDLGAAALLISAWLRYAGTPKTLSKHNAYALIILGQLFASIAQPIFQILGPKYSETWFGLSGRTTATMIIAIANPIGGALGQLISPLVGDTRRSILVLGIISTAAIPFVLLIGRAPPLPPTYAGSKPSPSLLSLVRAMLGLRTSQDTYMSPRERSDFAIVVLIFGTLVAGTNTFAILTAQILQPVGYSADTSGLMGACLLLTGIVAAIATAPLFDRVFTHHLALTSKILVPIVAAAWLSLIWAVKPHNTGGLFAIMTIIGVCSVTMLPVGLELACELTRNANGSSALLWFSGNLFGVIFVLCSYSSIILPLPPAYAITSRPAAEGALRAGPNANPPLNMRRALIFNSAFIVIAASLVFLLNGRQARKELDKQKLEEVRQRVG